MIERQWLQLLEIQMDGRGIKGVLNDMAMIAEEKADHVRTQYGDDGLALAWEQTGAVLVGIQDHIQLD